VRQAEGRITETLIGAAVGIVVNPVVAPPLQVRPAAEALAGLAGRLAEVLRGLAGDLRGEWSRTDADRWLDRARAAVLRLRAPTARWCRPSRAPG